MQELKDGILTYYDTSLSQDVTLLQYKYTLFKRVMNILTSMTSKKELDFKIMQDAFNKVVERNDCLRLRFVQINGKTMQYFLKEDKFDVPVYEFKTKEEQEKFINKIRRKTIKYQKGVVVEPYFIKTYDNRSMVLLKVAHLILDIYGINMIYKDLFEVYDALKNNKEMPELPVQYEDILKLDLVRKYDKSFDQKNEEFYTSYFNDKEEPYYAGIGGKDSAIYKKLKAKGKRAMDMLLVNIDTKGYGFKIDKKLVEKLIDYCREEKLSVSNFLFYLCAVNSARVNDGVENMLNLQLCNCRGTAQAKACAGMRVQSLPVYTSINFEKSFAENFAEFSVEQSKLLRHIGYSDTAVQYMIHKAYNSPFLSTYWSMAFSFIPFSLPEDLEFFLYSNEKSVLPAYLALLYDVDKNEIIIDYDVQTKIISGQDVENYHKNLIKLLEEVLNNPNKILKEI